MVKKNKLHKDENFDGAGTYDCVRLTALSDGIFSIATTLTVLEILPSNLNELILSEGAQAVLVSMYPKLIGVVITFFLVGIYWLGHHRIFSYIKRANHRLLQLNLLFLMLISFMPFAIKISGAHSSDRAAGMYYSVYMALTGLSLHLMWRYASRQPELINSDVTHDIARLNRLRTLVPPCIFLLSALITVIDPVWGRYSWLLLIFNRKMTAALFKRA